MRWHGRRTGCASLPRVVGVTRRYTSGMPLMGGTCSGIVAILTARMRWHGLPMGCASLLPARMAVCTSGKPCKFFLLMIHLSQNKTTSEGISLHWLLFAGLEEVTKPEYGGVRLTSRKGVQCRDEQRQGVMPETEAERQVTELTETEHRERPETTAESLERLTERSWEESATEAELIGLEAETSPTEVLWVQMETTEEGRALDEIAAVLELESVKAN